jgi:hypothetical protein
MMYCNFAIATLLGAPMIVMATQSLLPAKNQPSQAEVPTDAPPPPVPVPVAPPVAAPGGSATVDPASSFGQPMAGADQPAMAPGAGLPDTSAPPISSGMTAGMTAPPGSPNAEP